MDMVGSDLSADCTGSYINGGDFDSQDFWEGKRFWREGCGQPAADSVEGGGSQGGGYKRSLQSQPDLGLRTSSAAGECVTSQIALLLSGPQFPYCKTEMIRALIS